MRDLVHHSFLCICRNVCCPALMSRVYAGRRRVCGRRATACAAMLRVRTLVAQLPSLRRYVRSVVRISLKCVSVTESCKTPAAAFGSNAGNQSACFCSPFSILSHSQQPGFFASAGGFNRIAHLSAKPEPGSVSVVPVLCRCACVPSWPASVRHLHHRCR